MKCKCPYCGCVHEWDRTRKLCPECGKLVLPPGKHSERRNPETPRTPHRRLSSAWEAPRSFWGAGAFRLPYMRWIFFFGLLCVLGAYMMIPAESDKPRPETIELVEDNLFVYRSALEMFRKDCGRYPTTKEGLRALVLAPVSLDGWRGPYVLGGLKGIKDDVWRRPFRYACLDDGRIKLLSAGPDGDEGTDDDVHDPTERRALVPQRAPTVEDAAVSIVRPNTK